jgi:hypothetical protein
MQLGHGPLVEHARLDLMDIDRTTEVIAAFRPDIIFCAATMQPWRALDELPSHVAIQLREAQIGPWLPLHLTPVLQLMRAVKATGLSPRVVNATQPGTVNRVLATADLAPTTGVGDLANNVPALRTSVALELGLPLERVDIRLVASHHASYWLSRKGTTDGAPVHLAVTIDGQHRVTSWDGPALFARLPSILRRAPGQMMTAASAAVVFSALATGHGKATHAPGPNGLPGGYPVQVDREGVTVLLPDDITSPRAVELNDHGQRLDGIDQITEDGMVLFSPQQMSIMTTVLGYECRRMQLSEAGQWAAELRARFGKLVAAQSRRAPRGCATGPD